MFFVNGLILSRAVRFTGTGLHDPADIPTTGRLQYVEGTRHVRAHIFAWRLIGVGDGDQCRQVEDDVDSLADVEHEVWVAHVAAHDFHAR